MNKISKDRSCGRISNRPSVHACVRVGIAGGACQDLEEGKHSFQPYSKQAPELGTDPRQQQGAVGTLAERCLGQLRGPVSTHSQQRPAERGTGLRTQQRSPGMHSQPREVQPCGSVSQRLSLLCLTRGVTSFGHLFN